MKRIVVLVFLMFFYSQSSFSQVTGIVKSELDNSPIAFASVYWQNSKIGVLTNEDGEYNIPKPDNKKDSLVISYVGYKPFTAAYSQAKTNQNIQLKSSAHLEEVVVSQLTAQEIINLAFKNKRRNHFRNMTFQPGYSETLFYDNNQLFQVSQASYNIVHEVDEGKPSQELYVNKVRSVIDSALFKSINDELNFKRFDSTFGPEQFLTLGQSMNFGNKRSLKQSRKKSYNYSLIDEVEYQGENAYLIELESVYKDEPILKSKFYIEKETYAFLYAEHNTVSKRSFSINGIGKAFIKILGFDYDFKHAKIVSYYKRNQLDPTIFDLEKGFSTLALDVKRTDRWIKGKVTQEFYLLPKQTLVEKLNENYEPQTIVANFNEEEFFQGSFHLPTRKSTLDKIKPIQENNRGYIGGIASDRFEKWDAKKKRKAEKRKKRKSRREE